MARRRSAARSAAISPLMRQVAERRRAVDQHGVVVAGDLRAGPCAAAAGVPVSWSCSSSASAAIDVDLESPQCDVDDRSRPAAVPISTSAVDSWSPCRIDARAPRCSIPAGRGRRPAPGARLAAAAEASPSVTVVLPTPPFWFNSATMRPIGPSCHTWARPVTPATWGDAARCGRRPGRVASNVNSLGSGALP